MDFFTVLVYVAGYVFLVFLAVCLACGLYYLAELAEEFTVITKKLIQYTIIGVMVIHGMLLILDRFPFYQITVGLATHGAYLAMLKDFPFIGFTSPIFIGSCVLMVLDHYVWFQFFSVMGIYRLTHVLGFYLLCVWLVPFGYFVSLSVNDSVLPSSEMGAAHGQTKRGNMFLTIGNFVKAKMPGRKEDRSL